MNIKRITAIVPIDIVETLEKNLRARIPAFSPWRALIVW